MNNMIDSSSLLETLALNYASFGVFTVVNNLWTWVAVITAAISFWRIRTTSFSEKLDNQQPRIDPNTSGSQANGSRAQPSADTCVESRAPIPALPSVSDGKYVDRLTEGSKYTMYYYVDEEEEEERETESDGDDVDPELTVVKEWRDDDAGGDHNGVSCGEWWERVTMRTRIGDMGWYSYQDLTVVNGNVVRLWDECKRISEKSCSYYS